MKLIVKIALVTGVLALACGSAALAAKPADVPKGKGAGLLVYTPGEPTPGPKTGSPPRRKPTAATARVRARNTSKARKGPPSRAA